MYSCSEAAISVTSRVDNMDESFLITDSWAAVKKRIAASGKAGADRS